MLANEFCCLNISIIPATLLEWVRIKAADYFEANGV